MSTGLLLARHCDKYCAGKGGHPPRLHDILAASRCHKGGRGAAGWCAGGLAWQGGTHVRRLGWQPCGFPDLRAVMFATPRALARASVFHPCYLQAACCTTSRRMPALLLLMAPTGVAGEAPQHV